MSAETLAISAIVSDGGDALRILYSAGVGADDFPIYDDEFQWIEKRLARKKSLNRRIFMERFPEFEWGKPTESVQDLASELKEERVFGQITELLATLAEGVEKDNAIERSVWARDQFAAISRIGGVGSDVDLDDTQRTIEQMRKGMMLAKQGMTMGIPTGNPFLDEHWGGLMPGHFNEIIGRSGEGKSLFTMLLAWAARKHGSNVGVFTPEFNEHECRSRYHTVASADKSVQKAVGLERSFRNRALLFQRGFNLKDYQRFCEYVESMPGTMKLLSGKNRPEQMSVGYIENCIVDYGLGIVFVDPIYLLKPERLTADGNTYQEIAWIGERLQRLAEQYNIPIIFTNQAHFGQGASEDAPHKGSSFGAKALVHLADNIIGVKHMSDENKMLVRASKTRFGNDFRFEMDFVVNTGYWRVTTPLQGNYFSTSADDEQASNVNDIEAPVED